MAALGPQLSGKLGKVGKAAGIGLGAGIAGAFVAGKFLYNIGAEFDNAFDKIRVGTGKTGKDLRGLKRDFKGVVSGVPADFESASTAIAGLNQRLGLTGKPLRGLSKQMLELSRITGTDVGENVKTVTRLFGDWGIKTGQQQRTLDKLFRASQATGIGISTLSDFMVQFGSPLRQMGFDFDTAAAMFSKFEKEGVNLQTAMPGLRMALKNFASEGKDPAKALSATIDKIKEASSTAKANTMAFDIFGTRAGPDLAAAIREGRFDFDKLIKTIAGGKDTIRVAGEETMDFTERWEVFKNRVMVKLEPLASKVFDKLGDTMERVGDILTSKKLTSGEKFSKIFDMIADAGSKAMSAIAEKAGQYGPRAALAFVKGFIDADIWGKLAIGGLLLAKFGGLGSFKTLGTKMGRTLGTGVLAGFTAIELAKKLQEELADDLTGTPREEFATKLRGMFNVSGAQFLGGDKVRIATEIGDLIFSSKTERVVAAKGKKLQQFVGKIPETIVPKFDRLREIDRKFDGATQLLPRKALKVASGVNKVFLSKLDQLIKQGGHKSESFSSRVSGPFGTLNTNVGSALQSIIGNVRSALDSLGVKGALKQFALEHPSFVYGTGGTLNQERQQGGFIVPGNRTGDHFKTALPPDSFILNRNATEAFGFARGGLMPVALESKERAFLPHEVKAMGGPATLEAMNRAVPRFQKGGQLRKPVLIGPDGPLLDVGRSAVEKVYKGAQNYLDKHRPEIGAGYAGPAFGPKGTSMYKGILMATWVRQALEYAASKGAGPQPTSGYRSHAQNVAEGRTYFSEHEKTQYPGGAVDFGGYTSGLAAKMSVVNATRDFKYPLLAPIGFRDDGHASGTGHQRGGLIEAIQKLAGGGLVENIGSILMRNSLDLLSSAGVLGNAWRESRWNPAAVGTGGGGLWGFTTSPISLADLQAYAGSQGKPWTNAQVQTQFMLHHLSDSLKGRMNSLDTVEGTTTLFMNEWERPGIPALPDRIEGAKKALRILGGSGASDEHSFKEDVPAVYHGARTGSLDFPSIPKSLPGVNKEIAKWEGEIKHYRRAAKRADNENKPAVAHALQKNITAIGHFLTQLRNAKVKLRFEKAKKKFSKGLSKRLGKVTGYETLIEGLQRDYNIANQKAEQIVGLEPQQAELPASATDAQRETAEKDYVARFTDYVNSQERPAYGDVLAKEADWRNAILRAEYFGFGKDKPSVVKLEHNWEGQIRQGEAAMEHIKAFTQKVAERVSTWRKNHSGALPKWLRSQIKERDDLRDKLPWLRFKDTELRKVLGEGRAEFYPGIKNPILRPVPPLAGTGTLEGHLEEVQGIHWPDQHELLPASALAPPREAGRFGGAIWETQTAIEELGLKINQAASSLGAGAGGDSDADNSAQEELTRQANQRFGVSEAQRVALEGWDEMRRGLFGVLPRFHEGGRIMGSPHQEVPIMAKVGETVLSEEDTGRLERAIDGGSGGVTIEQLVIHEDGRATVRFEGREFDAAVERVTRKSRGVGILTPGGARR